MKRTITMRNKGLALFLLLAALPAQEISAQDREGFVTFVDSISCTANGTSRRDVPVERDLTDNGIVQSRRGWFQATFDTASEFINDGIIHRLRLAMDMWEEQFDTIRVPVSFHVAYAPLADSIGMITTVKYSKANAQLSQPSSLYSQSHTWFSAYTDSITVNANAEWDNIWPWEGPETTENSLTTAFLRQIAHILGFGTSVTNANGTLGFTVKNTPSAFDRFITDTVGNHLSAVSGSTALRNFLKRPLLLSIPGNAYPLFSSNTAYFPYASGKYFSLDSDNMMNYPHPNPTQIMSINAETLDVLKAIGWGIRRHDVSIMTDSLDAAGYGSAYRTLIFRAMHRNGTPLKPAAWRYQLLDTVTGQYHDVSSAPDSLFTLSDKAISSDAIDTGSCLEGRIVCTMQNQGTTQEYTMPIFLELRPELVSTAIQNISDEENPYLFSFDISIEHLGTETGLLWVSNGQQYTFTGDGITVIHVSHASKHNPPFLSLTLENEYGECSRFVYLNDIETKTLGIDTEDLDDTSFTYEQDNGKLRLEFARPADLITITDLSGKVWKSERNTKVVKAELPPGIYVVSESSGSLYSGHKIRIGH